MAPTAILATQHLENYKKMFNQFGIKCELLISAITKKKKQELLERLESGEIDILIGTHAIIEENVKFKNLGLVVTDEQHRFGVKQRTKIVEKGQNPDVLVMTATPIPRTLALILYGDLDISIIDELPPNRKKIDTFAVKKGLEERVNNFVKKQINEGRQCYIVCPLVEESEEMDLKSVIELYNTCKEDTFKEYKVEYIHGKMKPKEKDEIMEKFKNGKIDILINNAGISEYKMFTDETDDDWNRVINNNLYSAFMMSQEVIPSMVHEKSGCIINISSIWAMVGASLEVIYSVSKAGMDGLTKALAKELGPSNIRVNSIAPGTINTDMNKNFSKEELEQIEENTPLGRIGSPKDIAKCVCWLIDDNFTTGQIISINGGWVI